MDVLTQLLEPYRGWDPRTQTPRETPVSVGKHAKPVVAADAAEGRDPAPTTYIRAGRRRAGVDAEDAARPVVPLVGGQAV